MLAEEGLEHFHDAEFEEETALDLSEIRAGVEAQLVGQSVVLRSPASKWPCRPKQAHSRRIAEARMKGFEGDSCGAMRKLHFGTQRTCMKMQYLRRRTSGCS